MKVKSFVVGTVNGLLESIRILDEFVAELGESGEVTIVDLKDSLYCNPRIDGGDPRIVRVVIYKK
jgi:hypothetical protein